MTIDGVMYIEYEPGSGRITRQASQAGVLSGQCVIIVPLADVPANFSPTTYRVVNGKLTKRE